MSEKTIEELKDFADSLDIKYHPSISAEKLAEKIENAGKVEEPEVEEPVKAETPEELKKEATALVRCRVTCMNPAKREWEGELFCVGNKYIGTIKKYVPYGVEWHVPRVIFNMIKEKECQVFISEKRRTGTGNATSRTGRLIKEFAVEELPQLTEKELKALAQRQAMAAGTSEV